MKLFKSKFANLEAFADAKPEDRTPEMLAAAQADVNAAGVILVPMTDTVKTGADLQAHIDGLEEKATTATEAATTAQNALKALKGERVLPTQKVTSDKKKDGDNIHETAEEQETKAGIEEAHNRSYTQQAKRMLQQD